MNILKLIIISFIFSITTGIIGAANSEAWPRHRHYHKRYHKVYVRTYVPAKSFLVWVKGHWAYNKFGKPVWRKGHWKRIRRY